MSRWIRTYWDDYYDEVGEHHHVCIYTRVGAEVNSDKNPRRVGGRSLDGRGARARADARARAAVSRYDALPTFVSSR